MNKLAGVLLGLTGLLFIWMVIIFSVPWYSMKLPLPVTQKIYYPGDKVELHIDRSSLINLEGRVTRALFRIDKIEEIEILKVATYYNTLAKGIKSITLYYPLPTKEECPHLRGNSYIWRGTLSYKPFGMFTRELHWESEQFHIEVASEAHD
jgi:hypothetical protein